MGEVFFGDTGPIRTLTIAHEPDERAVKDLRLEPVSDSDWRVIDNRFADDDPAQLVGFIEQSAAGLSAMRLDEGRPSPWKKCGSMEEALELFVIAPATVSGVLPAGDAGRHPKHAAIA